MRTAVGPGTQRILATRSGQRAQCPGCHGEVLAACGEVKAWHWRHVSRTTCDWYVAETDWHRGWKSEAPADRQEVRIGNHRADIVTPAGIVVELQHSHLSGEYIRDRESAYGQMVWLFDAREARQAGRLAVQMLPDRDPAEDLHRNLRWEHHPAYVRQVDRPLFVDVGANRAGKREVLWVGGWWSHNPLLGRGWAVTPEWFSSVVINGTYYPVPPASRIALSENRLKRHIQRPRSSTDGLLNWSSHKVGDLRSCRLCGTPAMMRDAEGMPCHKICAEDVAWLDSDGEGAA